MSPTEHRVVVALNHASMLPGSGMKRFVRELIHRAGENPEAVELTPRQQAYLWAIAWSYRRQIPRDLSEVAGAATGGRGICSRKGGPLTLPPPKPRAKSAAPRPGCQEQAGARGRVNPFDRPLQFGDPDQIAALHRRAR